MAAYRRVDDLTVTCRLTACTPGSAPGPTLVVVVVVVVLVVVVVVIVVLVVLIDYSYRVFLIQCFETYSAIITYLNHFLYNFYSNKNIINNISEYDSS